MEYFLDNAQNAVNVSDFFAVTRVMEGGRYLGSLYLLRSLVDYPNPSTTFTLQVTYIKHYINIKT